MWTKLLVYNSIKQYEKKTNLNNTGTYENLNNSCVK